MWRRGKRVTSACTQAFRRHFHGRDNIKRERRASCPELARQTHGPSHKRPRRRGGGKAPRRTGRERPAASLAPWMKSTNSLAPTSTTHAWHPSLARPGEHEVHRHKLRGSAAQPLGGEPIAMRSRPAAVPRAQGARPRPAPRQQECSTVHRVGETRPRSVLWVPHPLKTKT